MPQEVDMAEQSILTMDEVRTLAGLIVHGIEASISTSWYERQLALKVLEQHAQCEAAEDKVSRLTVALKYVYDWLPLVFESGAVYDNIKVRVGDALRDDSGQDDEQAETCFAAERR
jgi:hypothetical protein